ncbi:TetR/AcrR family transcriptional regulator [Curtobacterium sp. PhB136]|uniref:TetR/AcrR family transcriptional regulator n=1 Tax=Curtobacterium sp. PhB136 TaxID=2485181 RepID=UPI0010492134|nr:TetR/AcrR family transcriptional regulator [Curtobacterium sp. PhB136]TCK59757.1 TetR family transcriptional regulator [Curtobacterium sp. PhB136]
MSSLGTTRRPRADAARNRAALVDAARTAFTTAGEDASLEAVARAAGVGIGTLYRNFPTREDLVAAVYGAELDAVLGTVDALLADPPADRALRAFADRYARFVAAKRGMAETVRVGAIRGAAETAHTRERVNAAVQRFLDAGALDGTLRSDMVADDVTAALIGVLLSTRDTEDPEQTGRLLDIVVGGLRAQP